MDNVCGRCGGTAFRYNRSRMRMECVSCGAPQHDEQQTQQLMQFDRTYAQAMEHLRAGNWERTIALLQPLLGQHPTEKKLHAALLRAATEDFGDLGVSDPDRRKTASDAWNKLVRLNGVDAGMLRYSRLRYELNRKELSQRMNRMLAWIFAAAFCAVLAGMLFGGTAYFWATVSLVCLLGCLWQIASYHPVRLMRRLSAPPDDRSDPFAGGGAV